MPIPPNQQVSPKEARELADLGPQLPGQKFYVEGLRALLNQIDSSQEPDAEGKKYAYVYFSYDQQMWLDGVILGSRPLGLLESDETVDPLKVEFLEHTND
jgi:hypothetical protein